MNIQENIPLAEHTTFKIGGPARLFCSVTDERELEEAAALARERGMKAFILGGGSNVLVSDEGFPGLVIKMGIMGMTERDGVLSAGAGELWDDAVSFAVSKGLYGIENLSAIPGTVGAAPIQNIGAYGAEAASAIRTVRAFDLKEGRFVELAGTDCRFGYRDSLFKHEKGRYAVVRVDLALKKDGMTDIGYRDLKLYFSEGKGAGTEPTLAAVRDAVIDIRWHKLPDWKLWGTAGSFFKNPIVAAEAYEALKARYPGLPGFPEPDGRVKLSLAWILDKVCAVKELCVGGACVYEKQALVVVAKPGASAAEVVALAQELMKRVKDATGIGIEAEVEWVN
ncbi:MAG: UDP-N-acetylmuramate dehydrogenase [Patescibacteria group bacterium]|nr:UDP-N-acetylmuramate dehydrogenase [Patescibacteria group bacterium]